MNSDQKSQPVATVIPDSIPNKVSHKVPSIALNKSYVMLFVMFLKFWFYESPVRLFRFFASLNGAFLHLFSLPLFLKTYFRPLKNEYRQGLVGFSRAMGMFIKTWLILADLLMFALLLLFEATVFVSYIFLPIATIWMLFL